MRGSIRAAMPVGMLLEGVVALVPAGGEKDDEHQEEGVDHQLQHVLGDADVEGLAAVLADYLPFVRGSFGGDVPAPVAARFEDFPGVECVYAAVDEDDGEMDGDGLALPFGQVPFVAVEDVFEDDVADIDVILRLRKGR